MYLTEKELEKVLLDSVVQKYGLMLNSKDCAKEIRAADSRRGLDEDRKKGQNCPEYIERGKAILYPVQNVVRYHLILSTKSIKILNF